MTSLSKASNALTQLSNLSGPQWLELGIKQAPQIVAGLAVIGIAWQAARLTWLLITPGQVSGEMALPSAPVVSSSSGNTVNPQSIADAHLFGTADASAATDPNNLPRTQVPLILAGTMALEDPAAGFAIVGENAANAKFYRVGAMMSGGVRLHAVYVDRVIIDRGGSLETLLLPRGTPSTAPAPVARNVVTNSVGANLRRLAASNPSALGELLRAQPVFSNGVQKGYRVYPGRDRMQFARLGLQPGDLVTAINGTPLDDPNRSSEILSTLTTSSTAQVIVERNGTSQALTLDMASITLPDPTADGGGASNTGGTPAGALDAANASRALRTNRMIGTPGTPPDASAQ